MSKFVIERKEIHRDVLEVLPCLFCGSDETTVVHYRGSYGYSSDETYVKCKCCGATGAIITDENGGLSEEKQKIRAIEEWNNRA